jgi:hypothetical protein
MQSPQVPATKTYAEVKATKRMRWWYEALADFMIAHPEASQNDMAAHFKKSAGTISTIINSDAFIAYLARRRGNYVQQLEGVVRTKMLNVADKGFDLILERFEKKRDNIPLETLNKTIELATRASGISPSGNSGTNVTVVNAPGQPTLVPVPVSVDDLQAARQALRNAQSLKPLPEPVDAEYTEVSSEPLDDLA